MLPSGMFMVASKFGYIITGKCPDNKHLLVNGQSYNVLMVTNINQVVPDLCWQSFTGTFAVMNPQLEDLWCLKTIGIDDPLLKEDDDEALEKLCESI